MVLTLVDLTPLSTNVVLRLHGNKRAKAMKKLHEKVRLHPEKKNQAVPKKVK